MNKNILRECLAQVAVVTRGWADDRTLTASLRHMSLHVHQLATEVGRRKELCSSSVRNVECRFCLMCRRLKAGSGECTQTLEQCQLLKKLGQPAVHPRLVNLGLQSLPLAVPDALVSGNTH
ncbi:MAG: hypothetical protein WAV95_12545 [Azonexus sp.]